jgi:hypothetical protein
VTALPTELRTTGLVVYPLTEEHEDEDTIEITGSCEDFCDQPGPTRAASVDIHGPLCRSRPTAALDSPASDQEPLDDLFLDPGAALRLAAALSTAAHQADQLARDLSASALSRERGRFDAV